MRPRSQAARIGVVIYDGVEPIDVGGTAGVVSMAKRILPAISSIIIAERVGPVRLAGEVTVMRRLRSSATVWTRRPPDPISRHARNRFRRRG